MQIRCAHCTRTVALAATGELPPACPHCAQTPGPGALGPYDAVRLIAAGGMGEVYLARHRELGTEVAIKVLPAVQHDALPALRERFVREARLTATVTHPGVVKVHGNGVAGDRPFLVLEYVAGQTLRERLRAGPLPLVEAARVVAAVADVLAAAHQEGVLHRDIKPDNVMLEPSGSVRVLDFGIARAVQDDSPITRTGEIVGTPEYMAPEQLLDGPEATTERTDVHALGVLLYELLTGRSPFHGANVFQALKLVESLVPPPPSRARHEVPTALDQAVAAALAKDPADRPAGAADFAAVVRAAVPAAELAGISRAAATTFRYWLWAAIVILAVNLGIAAAVVFGVDRVRAYWRADAAPAAGNRDASADPSAPPPAPTIADAERLLREGRWSEVLALAERQRGAGRTDFDHVARQAFVFAHVAWPLAAGAPVWLGCTDEAQRARWFGDRLEPPPGDDVALTVWAALLAGDGEVPHPLPEVPARARARLLALHLAVPATATALLQDAHDDEALAGDALAALLRIRLLPATGRAEAFAAFAQRLPITSAEHWLARLVERHHRGDRAAGQQAAEMAWLSGGGELAVLLDAFVQARTDEDRAVPTQPDEA
ncbi:MAG: serine/threonine-protein kinase, partial [Planctomycetota bacterium]